MRCESIAAGPRPCASRPSTSRTCGCGTAERTDSTVRVTRTCPRTPPLRRRKLDPLDRRLTAAVLRDVNADVVALQEVFDRESLDHFHDRFLLPTGTAPYPYRICLPGNDGRGNDVAVLSRIAPDAVESHVAVTPRELGIMVVPPLPRGPADLSPRLP